MLAKKTLVLTENFPPNTGGSGRWFWELYSRLPSEQYLVVTDENQSAHEFDQAQNIEIVRIPLQSPEWGFKSTAGLAFYWKTFWQLKKLIKIHGITHIHCGRVLPEGVIAWLLSLFSNVKYLCYVHGEDVETAATSREHHLMVQQVCKRAERLICNSYNSANIVKRLGYAKEEKLTVLHPGVNSQRFQPAPNDIEFQQHMNWHERTVLLTVGRLQQRKGHDMMIQAMAQLKEAIPNVLYCIIGQGETRPLLNELVAKHQLHDFVHFLDELSDEAMIQCYQQCDLFILPNRTIQNDIEGFGMVLVEAQCCAKPVVAGDSGGTAETMLTGETGFIIDCTNPTVIAKEVATMLSNPEQLKAMGKCASQFAKETFDWETHAQKAQAIFDSTH